MQLLKKIYNFSEADDTMHARLLSMTSDIVTQRRPLPRQSPIGDSNSVLNSKSQRKILVYNTSGETDSKLIFL